LIAGGKSRHRSRQRRHRSTKREEEEGGKKEEEFCSYGAGRMRGDREIRGGGGRYEERERGGGRGGPTRLYVGRLTSRIRSRDLEDLFTKYGR